MWQEVCHWGKSRVAQVIVIIKDWTTQNFYYTKLPPKAKNVYLHTPLDFFITWQYTRIAWGCTYAKVTCKRLDYSNYNISTSISRKCVQHTPPLFFCISCGRNWYPFWIHNSHLGAKSHIKIMTIIQHNFFNLQSSGQ